LKELADFPGAIAGVRDMADNGIRITIDLPETEGEQLSKLHSLKQKGIYLRIVIYDADEFSKAVQNKR
jgi:hypothetical protein